MARAGPDCQGVADASTAGLVIMSKVHPDDMSSGDAEED